MSGPAGKRHEVDLALRRLENTENDAERVAACLFTLRLRTETDASASAAVARKHIPLIVAAMKKYPNNRQVVDFAAGILSNLCNVMIQRSPQENLEKSMQHHLMPLIIQAMRRYSNESADDEFIQTTLCILIYRIIYNDDAFRLFHRLGGLDEILIVRGRFSNSFLFVQVVTDTLLVCASHPDENMSRERGWAMGQAGAIPITLQTMKQFSSKTDTVNSCLKILNGIAFDDSYKKTIVQTGTSAIVEAIQIRTREPKPNKEGLISCCTLLTTLANDDNFDPSLVRNGVIELLMEILKQHLNDSEVNEEAMGAMFSMVSHQDALLRAYECGIIDVVYVSMTKHTRHAVCQYYALGVIWNLCTFTEMADIDEIKVKIVDSGFVELMVAALRTFLSNEEVCHMGVGAFFQLFSKTQHDRVRAAVVGVPLKLVIKQRLREMKSKGCQIGNDDIEAFYKIQLEPKIKNAMLQDNVMGVIVTAYDRYQRHNESIVDFADLLKSLCIEWQNEKIDVTIECGMCGIKLNYKQGFKCSGSCNNVYYCTVGCQRNHWPKHKAQCKKVDNRNGGEKSKKKSSKTKK